MRCNNCNYKINKRWKNCPNCGNKIENNNLPFKEKHKEWVDKHLLFVNLLYCFPFNLIYTALPAYLVYLFFDDYGMRGNGTDVYNGLIYIVGISAIFPFLLMIFFLLFLKCYIKSIKLSKYAYSITKNKWYYLFMVLDIVAIFILIIFMLFF